MKVLFIHYGGKESLGIEYLSSALKLKGHKVSLISCLGLFLGAQAMSNKYLSCIFDVDRKVINEVVNLNPDIVAFSTFTFNYRWCLNIAQNVKERLNIPVVFGGVHTSAVPERVISNDFVDFAIIGEGEYALLDLVEYLEGGAGRQELLGIPNICFKYQGKFQLNSPRSYISDLDSLPLPDKNLFYRINPRFEYTYSVIASRGCPFNCSYCSNTMYHRYYCKEPNHVRRRSPDGVIDEILFFKKKGIVNRIRFEDEVFTLSEDWLGNLMEKYAAKISLPFWCQAYPLTITKEIVVLLKKGGCSDIALGIQSGSERIRRDIFNRKGTNLQYFEAISMLKEAGIRVNIHNIFGAPSETEDDLKQGYIFFSTAKADQISLFWLKFYPKTKIIDYAKQYKLLSVEDINNIEKGIGHLSWAIRLRKMPIYAKYELLLRIRMLIRNDKLYFLVTRFVAILPFKRAINNLLFLLVTCNIYGFRQTLLEKLYPVRVCRDLSWGQCKEESL